MIVLFDHNESQKKQLESFTKIWGFWPYQDMLKALKRDEVFLFSHQDGVDDDWNGAILVLKAPPLADLLYLYVCENKRKQGIARLLVKAFLNKLAEEGIERALLEVRPSNVAAQKLYVGFGFSQIDVRKSYYSDGEDALIFQKFLT